MGLSAKEKRGQRREKTDLESLSEQGSVDDYSDDESDYSSEGSYVEQDRQPQAPR